MSSELQCLKCKHNKFKIAKIKIRDIESEATVCLRCGKAMMTTLQMKKAVELITNKESK